MASRGSQQKQIGVALSEAVRDALETAASNAGHSIAEEIRQRIERTFVEDAVAPETRKLTTAINLLADLIEAQTKHKWFENPAATSVMKHAIDALLGSLKGGDGEATFLQDDLPPKETRFLNTLPDDPRGMGATLATVADLGERFGMIKMRVVVADQEKKSPIKRG